MKNWQIRRDQTIAFIRTAQVPNHADKRSIVADILQHKYPMDAAASRNLSQGKNWAIRNREAVKLDRSYRRACIAIRAGILGYTLQVASAGLDALGLAALQNALGNDLNLAVNHERMLLHHALHDFRTSPANFMANNALKMEANPNFAGHTPCLFYFNYNQAQYQFRPDLNANLTASEGIRVGGAMGAGYNAIFIRINVYNLLWTLYSAVSGNLAAVMGSVIQHDDLMVTDQLTGCSLMFDVNGTNMTIIHVQPDGPPGTAGRGHLLALTMRGAQFANGQGGGLHVLGSRPVENRPLDYNNNMSTQVVGIVRNGVWEIWAQTRMRDAVANITGSWKVS